MPPRDPRQVEAPRGTAIIRGTIVAADNGSPIRRAQVRLIGPRRRRPRGDHRRTRPLRDQGAAPPAAMSSSASKGGFVPLQYGQRRPSESGTPLDLGDGQVLDKLVIGLPRGSVISGRITDEFGEPVANAVVSAMRYGYQARRATADCRAPGRTRATPPTIRGTSASSAFRRANTSSAPRCAPAARSPIRPASPPAMPPTYYPGTPNVAEAQRVNVARRTGAEQRRVRVDRDAPGARHRRRDQLAGAAGHQRHGDAHAGEHALRWRRRDGADRDDTHRRIGAVPPPERHAGPLRGAGAHQSRRTRPARRRHGGGRRVRPPGRHGRRRRSRRRRDRHGTRRARHRTNDHRYRRGADDSRRSRCRSARASRSPTKACPPAAARHV